MTEHIIQKYLKAGNAQGRHKAGVLLSCMGIGFNLLLFLLKYTAGTLSGSVAITADGFNNLADSCSCILALLGFKIGDKQPNEKYPMGYGRLEYLSGLLISAVILFIGGRMLLSSVGKIIHPEAVDGCPTVIIILLISILIKGYMYRYNSKIGRMIHSAGMKAAAMDSLSDCIATLAILLSIIIEKLSGFNVDGYTGVLVALCILYAGITSVKDSVEPLLGKGLDLSTKEKLLILIKEYPAVKSVGHIQLHDYGPSKKLLTFEISAEQSEAVIRSLREEIKNRLGMEAVICPVSAENHTDGNKTTVTVPQYYQTKETQERE